MVIDLVNDYFDWMLDLVMEDKLVKKISYRKLLVLLYDTDFTFELTMDENRYEDGVDLRYRFGFEKKIEDSYVRRYLDNRPCSVLEMMVALSMKCEEHIMDDPDIGNRTGVWFWGMIDNLGLADMTDAMFDESYARNVIDTFLNREYKPNGEGGLFSVSKSSGINMREEEIWYQMMWYLNNKLDN